MKGKYLLIALVIAGIICGIIGYISYTISFPSPSPIPTPVPTPPSPEESPTPTEEETPLPPPINWHLMLRRVFLWENGKEQFVAGPDSDLCNYLLQTLPKINLQVNFSLSEEKVQEIKENDKVIVLSFRFTEDVTISQWIEPQDRDYIKTDEEGYRILEDFHKALFILEDNLGEGLQGHILVYSQTEGWSCWAVRLESGELDKTWIDEINKLLSEAIT